MELYTIKFKDEDEGWDIIAATDKDHAEDIATLKANYKDLEIKSVIKTTQEDIDLYEACGGDISEITGGNFKMCDKLCSDCKVFDIITDRRYLNGRIWEQRYCKVVSRFINKDSKGCMSFNGEYQTC